MSLAQDVSSIKKNLDSLITLLNKHRQQSIDTVEGHNTQYGDIISTQNNFYSSITFKPFTPKNETTKIKCFSSGKELNELIILFIFLFIFLLVYFNIQIFFVTPLTLSFKLISSVLIAFSSVIVSGLTPFTQLRTLEIESGKIIFKSKNKEIVAIQYENIRSFLKEKRFLTYDIHIYHTQEIKPVISAKLKNIHEANAIEQLVINKMATKE